MIGSNNQPIRNYGQYADVPEHLQAAVESGLNFFELRFQGEKRFNQNVFGFYDVVVTREQHPIRKNQVFYPTRYLVGRDAKIKYKCINQNTGLSVAFMPDDKFWHNRILLAFHPVYMIFAYHTRDSQVAGSTLNREIECLRDICQDKIETFAVLNQFGRPIFNSKVEAEADAFMAEKKKKPGRQSLNMRKIRRFAWETKSFVLDIIRNAGTEYGWTDSPEFEQQIKMPCLRLIDQRGISRTGIENTRSIEQMVQDSVARTIQSMSPEDLKRIIAGKLESKGDPTATEAASMVQGTGQPTLPAAEPVFHNQTHFKRMKIEGLKELAKQRGIPAFDAMTREDLSRTLYSDECARKHEWEENEKKYANHKTVDPVFNSSPDNKPDEVPEEEMTAA